jgi:hypothetical protein
LKELLTLSPIVFSYYSLSVLSAAFAGVYHVNILPPESFFPNELSKFFFSTGEGSLFNYRGVTKCLTPEEMIRDFGEKELSDFKLDPAQRKIYQRVYRIRRFSFEPTDL